KYGAYTLASFLGERFDSKLIRLTAALFLLVPSLMLLSAEIRIVAEVISQFTSADFSMLIFMTAGVIVVSTILGGMRSLTWTTGAQMLVMLLGMLTPLVILSIMHTTLPVPQLTYGSLFADIASVEKAGGLLAGQSSALSSALPGENILPVNKPIAQMFGAVGGFDFLLLMLSVMMGAAVLPTSIMRIGTASSVAEARRSIGWGVVLVSLLMMTVPAIAVFAKYIIYQGVIGQPFNDLPHWLNGLKEAGMIDFLDLNRDGVLGVKELAVTRDGISLILPIVGELPFVLVGFMAAAGMAAALSAGSAHMVSMSSSLAEDVFHGVLWVRASRAKRLLLARLSMILVTLLASLAAISQDFDVLQVLLWALSISASSFFAPMVLAIWWKSVSGFAIWVGMMAGFFSSNFLIWLHWSGISPSFAGIDSLTSAILGVPIAFIATIALSYLKPEETGEIKELMDEIRIPDGETIHDYKERIMTGRGL
ncbi:MAG: hypothetical protein L3J67_13640, partial [Hyphomicrobiaceae bacterium]|nr:hypothetical protein [Hyphomicrobiaceae bacterium]